MTLFDNLYKVSKKELKIVCRVLANAFSEDPLLIAMNMESEEIETMYEFSIRTTLRYGNVYATSENLEGIIAFTSDKYANSTTWNIIRTGAIVPAIKLGKKYGKFMREMGKIIEEDKKNLNIGPYLYLYIIGVSQESQGKGFGGKMLRAIIEKAENEGKSIFLETGIEKILPLYEHFGFEIIKKFNVPKLNVPMWEMVRNRN